jgi:hypothetical protein
MLLLSQSSLARVSLATVRHTALEVSLLFERAYVQVSAALNDARDIPVEGEAMCLAVCDQVSDEANALILRDLGGEYQAALGGVPGDVGTTAMFASLSEEQGREQQQSPNSAHQRREQGDPTSSFEKPSDDVEKVIMSPSTFAAMVASSNHGNNLSNGGGGSSGGDSGSDHIKAVCRYERDIFIYKLERDISLREFTIKVQTRIRKKNLNIFWRDTGTNGELITVQNESDWSIAKRHQRRQQVAVEPSRIEAVWECGACTFLNLDGGQQCEICGSERPPGYRHIDDSGNQRGPGQIDIIIEDVGGTRRPPKQRLPLASSNRNKPVWGSSRERASTNSTLGGGFVGNVRKSSPSPARNHFAIVGQSL